jgi:hypothetical protein
LTPPNEPEPVIEKALKLGGRRLCQAVAAEPPAPESPSRLSPATVNDSRIRKETVINLEPTFEAIRLVNTLPRYAAQASPYLSVYLPKVVHG